MRGVAVRFGGRPPVVREVLFWSKPNLLQSLADHTLVQLAVANVCTGDGLPSRLSDKRGVRVIHMTALAKATCAHFKYLLLLGIWFSPDGSSMSSKSE